MCTIVAALSVIPAVSGFLPALAQPGNAPGDCTGDDSQNWAQSVSETDPARYVVLDPDGSGVADEAPPCS
jgi:hypothetical protein